MFPPLPAVWISTTRNGSILWETIRMPTLIAVAFIGETSQPFVWTWSECRAVFSLERMLSNPTVSQLLKVDSEFRIHCKERHPESSFIGLRIPTTKGDASAAGISLSETIIASF
jgi:hypothetical protein